MIYGRELPGYPYDFKAKLTRSLVALRREVFGRYFASISSHAPLLGRYGKQFYSTGGNDMIKKQLELDKPCLIARFGCGEIEATLRGIDVQRQAPILKKIGLMLVGEAGPFWWDNSIRAGLCWNAGFFPPTDEALNAFSNRVCEDCKQVDILGSYLSGEKQLRNLFAPDMKGVVRHFEIEPFYWDKPWTMALRDKKVLVVNSFVDTIEAQYKKRILLFANHEVLPDFKLITYRSISSFAGNKVPYASWFEALDKMCDDISKIDFDIAIIGCGAYGMSIGAFIKRELKKKAIHLGGVTQILFGIKGKRWDDAKINGVPLYNEHWVRPFDSDKIKNIQSIEGGCYW